MANQVKTYNPKDVSVIFGPWIMTGFAEDSKVVVERDEDAVNAVAGTDGQVSRSINNNKMGTVKLSLAQVSESNAVLSAAAAQDEAFSNAIYPLTVKDNGGNDLHISLSAWVQKMPASNYNKNVEAREWTIRCADLSMFVGGS